MNKLQTILVTLTLITLSGISYSEDKTLSSADIEYFNKEIAGEYISLRNGIKQWISENFTYNVHFIIDKSIKYNDTRKRLIAKNLINQTLKLNINKKTNIKKILSTLKSNGVTTKCNKHNIKILNVSINSNSSIIRIDPSNPKNMADMHIQRSQNWAATYVRYRAEELRKTGVLPFFNKEESALAKKLPLEKLPFDSSSTIYKISNSSIPIANWCG